MAPSRPRVTTSRTSRTSPTSGPTAPAALTPARRRLFVAVTLALPWLLLLLLEAGLRVGGYGDAYPLFVPYADKPGFVFANEQVGRRWFGKGPFTPSPQRDFFEAEKPPNTFRVFFQGESSAQGFPYGHGGAPSRMLEERLQATFPGRNVEVVNTAFTAISSYALLDQADEIIARKPDAVLIYTGHNEYYGVFGAGSKQRFGHWPPLVRAYLALRRLRTVQLLANAIGTGSAAPTAAPGGAGDAPRTVMELMAGDQRVPLGSPAYEDGVAQFRGNLGRLLDRYRAHGIPVLVGTVASNERDQRPFVGGPAPGDSAAWWRSYREGEAAAARGDDAAAERAFLAAVRADSQAADAHYALGTLYDRRGDAARAHAAYRAAKERDQLRFRAPEAINRVIREEAARRGATVVETQRALEQASPGGTVGRTLVLEHLHPNLDGYFVIADAFYEAMRRKGMVGPWTAPVAAADARRRIPVTGIDSLTGILRTDRLTSGWPFQPRGVTRAQMVDTLRPTTPVERLAQATVLGTMPWAEATDRLRQQAEKSGDADGAIRASRALAFEYRYSARPYVDAARVAVGLHRYDEALGYARAAAAREESVPSLVLAGLLLLRANQYDAGMPYLERAVRLGPEDQRATVPLTAARSIPYLERGRVKAPRDTAVLFNLAMVYALTQQYEKSRDAVASLRQVSPNNAAALELLRQMPKDTAARGAAAGPAAGARR